MRTLMLSALLLTAAAPVLAQVPPPEYQQDYRDGDHRDGDRRGDYRDGDHRGDDRGGDYRDGDRRDGDHRDWRDGEHRDGDHRDWRDGDHRDGDHRDWRDGQRREFRDDRRDYRQDEQFARFRVNPYYYPRGYAYRYYGPGVRLPRVFFGTRYYIGQPDYYRLPPAYAGTRWVRVGPDALLIRVYDGIVVRTVRGIFY